MTTEKIGNNANLSPIARSRMAAWELRDDLLKHHGGVVTSKQMGELLFLDARAVEEKRARHELLAVNVDEGFHYPICQLDDGEAVKGLGSILSILYGGDEYVDSWLAFQILVGEDSFVESNSQGVVSTPLQALKGGYIEIAEKAAACAFKHAAR